MGINVTEELLEKIDNYLRGNLSSPESLNFSKEIDANPELKEIVLIQQGLFDINDYQFINKSNNSTSLEAINHYKKQINKDENKRRIHTTKSIA